ncbi:unnamed protein product [Heterobilharzia americana]|nr:unnamed protein product [Heterobilharzia americana]
MVHPAHHNRPLVSPNSVSRPVIGSRPLPSSHLGNGNAFTGGCSDFFLGGETDINCGLISSNCPSHSEAGWIGLPGRPIICLIECLLDAAAIVVEATNLQTRIELPSWGHMEKASFYLCLAVKVSLLTLFQQRRLVGSVSRLLACQHQEARLLTLLSTIPKDVTTVLAMCETLCHLLGPPISSRILSKLDYSSLMQLWWWSSLGLTVHSDTYPVHAVAEFVLNYLLDTQKLNQLVSFSICWIHSGNGSNNNNNLSSVRIDDMVFTLVTRAMRLSILENYGDNSAPGPSLTRSISSPQLLLSSSGVGGGGGSGNQGYTNSPRANYNYRDRDHFNNLGGHICGGGDVVVGGGLETALAVNTEVSDQEFSMPPLTSVTVDSLQFPGDSMNANFDNRQRYPHPPNTNHPASCRWDHHLQPVPDYDRSAMTTPNISSPPLPSVFAISTQNCLKSNNGSAYFNFPCNNLPVYPTYNPQNIIDTNNISTNHTHTSNFIRSARIDDIQHFEDDNQDPQYLRCLETLKLRQTRLAVALIRVSKSHIHRLDQIVQICDQNIHSTVSLLAISQQVFAEAMGWKLRSLVNRKPPSTTNLLDSTYGECACLLNGNSPASLLSPSNATNIAVETFFTRDRIYLISTAFHLALIGVLRTSRRSIYWRRREALVWAVSTVLHVGPSACLYLISHWSSYLNAREAVVWLAPALLTAMDSSDSNIAGAVSSAPRISKSLSSKVCPKGQPHPSAMEGNMCFDHSLFFRVPNWDDLPNGGGGVNFGPTIDASFSMWPSWYSFCAATFTSKNRVNSISMAAQLLSTAVPYSKIAREQIINAVRHMALQGIEKEEQCQEKRRNMLYASRFGDHILRISGLVIACKEQV